MIHKCHRGGGRQVLQKGKKFDLQRIEMVLKSCGVHTTTYSIMRNK